MVVKVESVDEAEQTVLDHAEGPMCWEVLKENYEDVDFSGNSLVNPQKQTRVSLEFQIRSMARGEGAWSVLRAQQHALQVAPPPHHQSYSGQNAQNGSHEEGEGAAYKACYSTCLSYCATPL